MHPTKTVPDLLLACVSHTPPDELTKWLSQCSPAVWEQMIALAVEQQVAALLYHRLKMHGCEAIMPSEIRQQLQKNFLGNTLRNMQLYQALKELARTFHEQRIPILVLKGAYLAATVYESIALRTMVDLDILTPQAHLVAAIAQMDALGYQPTTPWHSLDAYLAYGHHVPPFSHPNGIVSLELHWRITRPNRAYTIAMDELWMRSKPITLRGIVTQGFCPEDLLLHICMHATYHHWFQHGVRSLCDIAELLRYYGDDLDWDAVIQRAHDWDWQRGVFLALSATQQLLGVRMPALILARLNTANLSPLSRNELQALLFPTQRVLLNSPTGYFLNFLNSHQQTVKVRLLMERLFLTRQEMAATYGIAVDSPWLYPYYGVRLKDLLGRFASQAWRMYWGDEAMTTAARQQERLQRWLEQS